MYTLENNYKGKIFHRAGDISRRNFIAESGTGLQDSSSGAFASPDTNSSDVLSFRSRRLQAGPISIAVSRFEKCKGPRRRDCSDVNLDLNNGIFITYDLLVKSYIKLTTGRIVATSNGKEMVRFQMKTPCDHFLVQSLFKIYLNLSKECAVKKGHYVFKVNLQDLSQKYFDGKYFYGNWTFRSVFAGSECNFMCTILEVLMSPKKV
ncbi:uncharacterized protein LOC114250810 [Bombyx mandarina]|uniref:Uncharacterized protein LOC114250810 n=1 Tax=Bombyx mandarina TaxID=7092 RepID=A0A6J2KE87_BOMMA|nr:uncharacterized protein LOC114250810 [Bombyx mandarina]